MTRGHALRLAAEGITVNAVAPGLIDTEMGKPLIEAGVALAYQWAAQEPATKSRQPFCCLSTTPRALHASLFKAPHFSKENEWRMIAESLPGRSDLCFRSSADKLIPYIETPKRLSCRLPVASIDIGPAMDAEASRGAVQALLDAKGYHGVKISAADLSLSISTL